jgi:steroid delta-isomerase-like uncharacterized protein
MRAKTEKLIRTYYDAFNHGDMDTFVGCLTENVAHDVNQGGRETGKAKFRGFMKRMNKNYKERLTNIKIVASADGKHAAAEFIVNGAYLATDTGLPKAKGQKYKLPGGAFFDIKRGKIARITNYYNLQDWLKQIR